MKIMISNKNSRVFVGKNDAAVTYEVTAASF